MGMKNPAKFQGGKIGAGLDHRGEGVGGRRNVGEEHAAVEVDGVKGETELGGGLDEGIEEE